MKKLAIILSLCATPVLATELPVPKPQRPVASNQCKAAAAAECEAKNWTKAGKWLCYKVKARKCR